MALFRPLSTTGVPEIVPGLREVRAAVSEKPLSPVQRIQTWREQLLARVFASGSFEENLAKLEAGSGAVLTRVSRRARLGKRASLAASFALAAAASAGLPACGEPNVPPVTGDDDTGADDDDTETPDTPEPFLCAPNDPRFFASGLTGPGVPETLLTVPVANPAMAAAGDPAGDPLSLPFDFSARAEAKDYPKETCLTVASARSDLDAPGEARWITLLGPEVRAIPMDNPWKSPGVFNEVPLNPGETLDLTFRNRRGSVWTHHADDGLTPVPAAFTPEGTIASPNKLSPFFLSDEPPKVEASLTPEGADIDVDFTGTSDEGSSVPHFLSFAVEENGSPLPVTSVEDGLRFRVSVTPGPHHLTARVTDPNGSTDVRDFDVMVDLCNGVTCENPWEACTPSDGICRGDDPCDPVPCLNDGVCAPNVIPPEDSGGISPEVSFTCSCDPTRTGPLCASCAEGLINPTGDGTEICRPPEVSSALLNPSSAALIPGETRIFTATSTDEAGNIITPADCQWRVEPETFGTVTEDGTVTVNAGTPGSTVTGTVVCAFQNSATGPVEARASITVRTPELPDTTPPSVPVLDLAGTYEARPGETGRMARGTVSADTSVIRFRDLMSGASGEVSFTPGQNSFSHPLPVPSLCQFSAGDNATPPNFSGWTDAVNLEEGVPPAAATFPEAGQTVTFEPGTDFHETALTLPTDGIALEVRINGGEWLPVDFYSPGMTSLAFDLPVPADSVLFRVTDSAGWTSESASVRTQVRDLPPGMPVVSFAGTPGTVYEFGPGDLPPAADGTGLSADTVKMFRVNIDTGEETEIPYTAGDPAFTDDTLPMASGRYHYEAEDAAGQRSPASGTLTAEYDDMAPSAPVPERSGLISVPWGTETFETGGTVPDLNDTVSVFARSADGTEIVPLAWVSGETRYTGSLPAGKTWVIVARDSVGNESVSLPIEILHLPGIPALTAGDASAETAEGPRSFPMTLNGGVMRIEIPEGVTQLVIPARFTENTTHVLVTREGAPFDSFAVADLTRTPEGKLNVPLTPGDGETELLAGTYSVVGVNEAGEGGGADAGVDVDREAPPRPVMTSPDIPDTSVESYDPGQLDYTIEGNLPFPEGAENDTIKMQMRDVERDSADGHIIADTGWVDMPYTPQSPTWKYDGRLNGPNRIHELEFRPIDNVGHIGEAGPQPPLQIFWWQ